MRWEQYRQRQARICRTLISDWNRKLLSCLRSDQIPASHLQCLEAVIETLKSKSPRYAYILGCTPLPLVAVGEQAWRSLITNTQPSPAIPVRTDAMIQLIFELVRVIQAIIPRDPVLVQLYTGLSTEELSLVEFLRSDQILEWSASVEDIRLCNSRNPAWWSNMLMYCDDSIVTNPTAQIHLYNETVQCAPYAQWA